MVQKGECQDYFINNFSSCWWKVFFFKKRPRSGETGAAVRGCAYSFLKSDTSSTKTVAPPASTWMVL